MENPVFVDELGRKFSTEEQIWSSNEFNFKEFKFVESFFVTLYNGDFAAAFIFDFVKPEKKIIFDKKERKEKIEDAESFGRVLLIAYGSMSYRFIKVENDFSLSLMSDFERRCFFYDVFRHSLATREYNFVLHGRDYSSTTYGFGIASNISLFNVCGLIGVCYKNGSSVLFWAIGKGGEPVEKSVKLCFDPVNENNVLEFDCMDFEKLRNDKNLDAVTLYKLKKILDLS